MCQAPYQYEARNKKPIEKLTCIQCPKNKGENWLKVKKKCLNVTGVQQKVSTTSGSISLLVQVSPSQ